MSDERVRRAVKHAAKKWNIDFHRLLAVVITESAGRTFAMVDGQARTAGPVRGALFRPQARSRESAPPRAGRAWPIRIGARSRTRVHSRRGGTGCCGRR